VIERGQCPDFPVRAVRVRNRVARRTVRPVHPRGRGDSIGNNERPAWRSHVCPSRQGARDPGQPNLVKPGITPYAPDILCSHLELEGFDVEVVDLTFRPTDWDMAAYFADRDPLLIGVTIRNAGSVQPQEQRVFLHEHLAILDRSRACSEAPIVLGGAASPRCPTPRWSTATPLRREGARRAGLCALANALATGSPPHEIPGLLLYDGRTVVPAAGAGHPRHRA